MREAKARGCHFIVYPELALTTFFPRWYFPTQPEVDFWFEREMPGPETQALFDEALDGIAQHIQKFWEPRMRGRLLTALTQAEESNQLLPIVREALQRHEKALAKVAI